MGTTYSCVGVWRNGRVEICANEQGHRITPSYVSWMKPEGTRLIGDSAKNAAASNPTNTVFDVKRLIGRKFGDSSVQKDKTLFPFELVKDKEGKPNVRVEIKGEMKEMSPEEVSGMVRASPLTSPFPLFFRCCYFRCPYELGNACVSPHSFTINCICHLHINPR